MFQNILKLFEFSLDAVVKFRKKSVTKVMIASATAYFAFKTLKSILNYFKYIMVTSSIKGAPITLFIGNTQIARKYGIYFQV